MLSHFCSEGTCGLSQSSQRAGLWSESPTQMQSRRDSPATTAPFALGKRFPTCSVLPQDKLLHKHLILLAVFVRAGPCVTTLPFAGPCAPGVRPAGTEHLEDPCLLQSEGAFLSLQPSLPSLGVQRGFLPAWVAPALPWCADVLCLQSPGWSPSFFCCLFFLSTDVQTFKGRNLPEAVAYQK